MLITRPRPEGVPAYSLPADPSLRSYGIWLRHVGAARSCGLARVPRTVAQLGPGSSVGVGLAALICGADEYFGLDDERSVQWQGTLELFDGLAALLSARTPPRERLDELPDPKHVQRVRLSVQRFMSGADLDGAIRYAAPWLGRDLDCAGEAGLVVSHEVLERCDSLPATLEGVAALLAPEGYATHQVRLGARGLNRETLLSAVRRSGLEVVAEQPVGEEGPSRRTLLVTRKPGERASKCRTAQS